LEQINIPPRHGCACKGRVELDERGIGGISVRVENLLGTIRLRLRQDHTDTWTFDTVRLKEPVSNSLSGARWSRKKSHVEVDNQVFS
jgi:hypothetical protein